MSLLAEQIKKLDEISVQSIKEILEEDPFKSELHFLSSHQVAVALLAFTQSIDADEGYSDDGTTNDYLITFNELTRFPEWKLQNSDTSTFLSYMISWGILSTMNHHRGDGKPTSYYSFNDKNLFATLSAVTA